MNTAQQSDAYKRTKSGKDACRIIVGLYHMRLSYTELEILSAAGFRYVEDEVIRREKLER